MENFFSPLLLNQQRLSLALLPLPCGYLCNSLTMIKMKNNPKRGGMTCARSQSFSYINTHFRPAQDDC